MTDQNALHTPLFDTRLRRARQRRFAGVEGADFLWRRLYGDTIETLAAIIRKFTMGVEMGARFGGLAARLTGSDAEARIEALISLGDRHEAGLALIADEGALPFAPDSLDLIVSTLGLHAQNDLLGCLIQAQHALKPDGFYLASLFGGETLKELRTCLFEAEIEVRGGAGPRFMPMCVASDLPGLLKRAGFNMPVVDSDSVRVTYDHPLKLMNDLRAMGETNILLNRPLKGLSRALLARMSELYFERFADPEGRIIATFELISIAGWKPHESQQKPLRPGTAKTRLADALGVKETKL